jgi:hypothetical protein
MEVCLTCYSKYHRTIAGRGKFYIECEWIEEKPAATLKLPKITEIGRKLDDAHEIKAIDKAIEESPIWGILTGAALGAQRPR